MGPKPRGRVVRRPKVSFNDPGLAAALAGFGAEQAGSVGGRERYGSRATRSPRWTGRDAAGRAPVLLGTGTQHRLKMLGRNGAARINQPQLANSTSPLNPHRTHPPRQVPDPHRTVPATVWLVCE